MISAQPDSQPELLATDMEVGLRVPLNAEVERPGAAVLPARLLLDVVRSLPAEQLTLELRSAERDVELISGPATFHLRTLRAEDFPTCPQPEPDTRVTLPAEAFVDTVSRVARSASRDETRPVLTGILCRPRARSCGWWRPTPTGCASSRRRLEPRRPERARGQRAGARAAGARRASPQPATTETLSVSRSAQPDHLRARRHRPLLAPDRRPVPQLPPAAAGARSTTSCAVDRQSWPRSCAASACSPRRTRRCG